MPNTRFKVQSRTGWVVRLPIVRALCGRGIPETREVLQMAEERLEEAHAMAKADDVRVQDHVEVASALVLGLKLQQTVGQEGFRIFQPRSKTGRWKHQKKLIVKMIVVGQGEQGARCLHVRRPVVRNIVGKTIAHIRVASVEQQVDGVRADGADRKRVALAGQGVPSRWALPGDAGEAGGRGLDALAFLVFSELADVFVLEAVRGDLVAVLQDRPHRGRIEVTSKPGETRFKVTLPIKLVRE